MDVNKNSLNLSLLVRLISVAVGLFYWLFVSANYPQYGIQSLTILAMGMLFSAWIPLGSVAHLKLQGANRPQELTFFLTAIILTFAYVTFSAALSSEYWNFFVLPTIIAASCACERMCLAISMNTNKLWMFYGYSSLLRVVSILLLYFYADDTLALLGFVVISDASVRIMCFLILKVVNKEPKPNSEVNTKLGIKTRARDFIKVWLASAMQNSIYWFPLSYGLFISAAELSIARLQIFILGFASVFYANDTVLSMKRFNVFGFVTSRTQLSIIFCACFVVLLPFVLERQVVGFDLTYIPQLSVLHSSLIVLTILLLCLSWNGAKVVKFHNARREWNMSLVLFCSSILLTFLDVSPPMIIFVIGLFWHVIVIMTYPFKENRKPRDLD
jgi:hypothetical protein